MYPSPPKCPKAVNNIFPETMNKRLLCLSIAALLCVLHGLGLFAAEQHAERLFLSASSYYAQYHERLQQHVYFDFDISRSHGELLIYCDGERIDVAEFPAFVEQLVAREPRTQIWLNGQCDLPWENMKELMEICVGKGADVAIRMQCEPEQQNN